MKSPLTRRIAALTILGALGLLAFGCSKSTVHIMVPNQRPSVEITSAPANASDTSFYAYQIYWSGYDPDGQVDHYTYAVDPTDTDTLWQSTTKKGDIFFFRATAPVMGGPTSQANRSVAPHIFVIKAWDNSGTPSAPKFRAFTSYTVSPTVIIADPQPLAQLMEKLTPATRISWSGTDPDGQFTQKPIKYKYKLFANGNTEFNFDLARTKPDSLRRFYAKTNFANWDSVGGDTTTVQYTGLLPNQQYLFVVIGYDEAGAYSPIFSLTGNMLQFQVGFAGTLGPVISVYNESFQYDQLYGSWYPDVQSTWFPLEIPANKLVTFNWSATPPPGGLISYYRWMVNGNTNDQSTPRTNEATDWVHWSAKSSGTTSCTIGPFAANQQQLLYIGAWDNNGLFSCVTLQLKPVQPTFENPLLVVNDTRAEEDKVYPTSSPYAGQTIAYTGTWPAYAELDTFLFARGGVPWRGTQAYATGIPQPYSKPGLMAGYPFDTLGTRQGLEIASAGVPLSTLGKYKHIMWIVDHNSAAYAAAANDITYPMSTLHWMCTVSHQNTLGAYINAGGSVWLAGGTGAYCATISFNATGAKDNDKIYGNNKTVFSFSRGELLPGRIMYDAAHWQNECLYQFGTLTRNTIFKSSNTPRAWSMPGYNYIGTVNSPNYNDLPATLRPYSLALGDSVPPTRTSATTYYNNVSVDLEYITQPTYILENISQDPNVVNEVSALDTLMEVKGAGLAYSTIVKPWPNMVTMSYYHGVQKPDFIFTGFPLWFWTRSDCIKLIDFVLQDIWQLPRTAVTRAPMASIRPLPTGTAGGARSTPPAAVSGRMPVNRPSHR